MGKKKSRNRSKNKAVAQSGAVKKQVQVSPALSAAIEKKPAPQVRKLSVDEEACYSRRFGRHFDELKWLYMELYDNSSMFAELCDNLHRFYEERDLDLKEQDAEREKHPGWYKTNDMLGMMFYIDNFAGNMKGVESKLDYIEKSNVNYIHLMPFLDTVEGRSDGGYAVADFRKVSASAWILS